MADTTKEKQAPAKKAAAAPRKMRTPEQRIADLEAQLAAARKAEVDKARAQQARLGNELAALRKRRDELNTRITAKEEEFNAAVAVVKAADDASEDEQG